MCLDSGADRTNTVKLKFNLPAEAKRIFWVWSHVH